MDVNDLTLREIKGLKNLFHEEETCSSPFEVGGNYLIRTVTMTIYGTLKSVGQHELVLRDSSWIADTGRFADSLINPTKFSEVEPFKNDVIVGRGSIVDATIIDKISLKQK